MLCKKQCFAKKKAAADGSDVLLCLNDVAYSHNRWATKRESVYSIAQAQKTLMLLKMTNGNRENGF